MLIRSRRVSLLLRRMHSVRECWRILGRWTRWRKDLRQLPAPCLSERKKLLIIRLDDIGDYLLFRNHLSMYKNSSRWEGHSITLLGNASWRDLFTMLDQKNVDDTIWVNKNEYLQCATYRAELWSRLRMQGFETVIAPSRTRPLLLDDLCTLAAAPLQAIGSTNTYVHSRWNHESDDVYDQLFPAKNPTIHEFLFNGHFTAWVCGGRSSVRRPHIDYRVQSVSPDSYIVCCIGANTRSKRWPVKRWIEFINLYRQGHSLKVILAGAGTAELEMAQLIQERTHADSIVGKVSLPEFLHWVMGARVVLTNDTMAAHLSASCNRPTIIIANGVNYFRFTEYRSVGIDNVVTVYPDVFTRRRDRLGDCSYPYEAAISADIASIQASTVIRQLQEQLSE
jgi:ADP-heptose:LPS heptosyltransferase